MPDERGQQRDGDGEGGDDRGAAPAVLVGPQEAEHQEEQGDREGDLAGDVDLAGARVARLHDLRAGDPQAPRAQGHVDEEDPLPVQAARERAADERPDGERRADGGAVGGQGAGALLGLGEGVGEDRQRDGEHHRGAQALGGPRGDERLDRGGGRAGGGGEGEEGEAAREEAAAAEAVGQRAGGQHDARERQRVRVDDPLQAAEPGAEVVGDPGQRRVHDRDVEHEHRGGDADDGEGPALRGHVRQRRPRRRLRAGGCPARRR